jgi:hypothetical protein
MRGGEKDLLQEVSGGGMLRLLSPAPDKPQHEPWAASCQEEKFIPITNQRRLGVRINSHRSLNHLVGADEQRRRYGEAKRVGGLEIEDQFDLRNLLDGQVRRLFAL